MTPLRISTGSYPSALPSPPLSFERPHSIEQIGRQAQLEELGISSEHLDDLRSRFNEVGFRIMNDDRFDDIVLKSVEDRRTKGLYQRGDIEAEIKRRMDDDVSKLDNDLIISRSTTFTEILKAVPDDKQLRFYLIRLLNTDNIYAMKSFMAYGIVPLLKLLVPKATERTNDIQAPRKENHIRQRQSRSAPKSRCGLVKGSNSSSSTNPASKNTLRRSPRLAGRPSQQHGIRKTTRNS